MWRVFMVGLVGTVLVGVACTKPNPRNCSDGICEDPAFPYCDVDGRFGGTPETCIPVDCSAGEFVGCQGNEALTCASDGFNYDTTTCESGCSEANRGCNSCTTDRCVDGGLSRCVDGLLQAPEACAAGCVDAPSAHCAYVQPRYLPDICDQRASGTFKIASSGTIDTQLDTNCNGGIVSQAGAGDLCVMRYASIEIASGATLKVVGGVDESGGGRALALVSDEDLVIEGTLDISADGLRAGPGGGETQSGPSNVTGHGQGGAGFRSKGGDGGSPTMAGGAANGGPATANPATLAALTGGPRRLGGGGGAATMISCRGTVRISGVVNAGGGGGVFWSALAFLAGCGGAGGYVVVQGVGVEVTGMMFANGGGGAAGSISGQTTAPAGSDGVAESRAAGGGYSQVGGGEGGAGAWRNAGARPGGAPTVAGGTGGGGGGSMGFFQTYTPAGITPTLTPAVASPPFEPNETIPTR